MRASLKVGAVLVFCYLVAWLDRMAIALTLPEMEGDIGLDPQRKGLVISAFFLGYALCQVPGGLLADRFGPRKVILAALGWWSVFTAVTGAAWSVGSMLIARFLFGVGEGVFPASVWKVIAQWFTKKNRATANALIISAIAVGPALTPFLLVPLIGAVGWRWTYVCIGLLGVLCVAATYRFVFNTIHDGRGVSREEVARFEAEAASAAANLEVTGQQATFGSVARTPLVWVLFAVGLVGNIGMYGWLQWLPSFFRDEYELSSTTFMVACALPWVAASVGCALGGFVSDRLFRGRRKVLVFCCQVVGVSSLYLFTRASDGGSLATSLAFQCLAGFSFFMGIGAIWGLPMNLLPTKVMGAASGLINTGGQIGGILSGVVIGWYIENHGRDYSSMWDVVLLTGAANALIVLLGVREKKRARPAVPAELRPSAEGVG